MRLGIGKYIGGLALAAMFAFGAAPKAHAQTTCSAYTGSSSIYISLSANCSISGNLESTGGSVTVIGNGYTFSVSGTTKSASGSDVSISGTGNTSTGAITSGGNVTVSPSNGNITFTGAVTSAAGDFVYLNGNQVTTKAITAGSYINATAAGSGNSLAFNGAIAATNQYILLYAPSITASSTVSAGSYLQATAATTSIDLTGKVSSGTYNSQGGNILMYAQTNVTTGAVDLVSTDAASAEAGTLDIHAWQGGGTVPVFTIGGSGLTNGVNGTITMSTASGGGTNANDPLWHGGVNIWNGIPGSTGGIKVTSASDFALSASASRAPFIDLQAYSGTISMPTGTISLNGASGQQGGYMILLANEITFAGSATLSAVDNSSAGSQHAIYLAANTVTYATALTIHADGPGSAANGAGGVYLEPLNTFYLTDNFQPTNLLIQSNVNGTLDQNNQPLTYSGTGALTVTANGDNTLINMSGYPISISGSTALIQDQGTTNHTIFAGYSGSFYGASGLVLNGTGAVTFDASGKSGNAGSIQILVDQASITAPSLTLNANGPSSGAFNGGTIQYSASATTTGSSFKGLLEANGAPTGNGGTTINLFPGNSAISLGTNAGDWQVLANGGTTSGNGGTIDVNPAASNGNVTIDTANAVSASAGPGGNGTGGSITILANPNLIVNSALSGGSISVVGQGTGNGGSIKIWGSGNLSTGTGTGALNLSAQSMGTGNGGSIEIGYVTNLTLGGEISVDAGSGSSGNGTGGSINIHDIGGITAPVSVTLDASGQGTGNGGTITIGASGTMDLSNGTLTADGGCNSGNGGTITINNANVLDEQEADASGDGGGGTCPAIAHAGGIHPNTSGNANGGTYTINNVTTWNAAKVKGWHQDGQGTGNGGTLTIKNISAVDLTTMSATAKLTALGGTGSNTTLGGSVSIQNVFGWPGVNQGRLITDLIQVQGGNGLAEGANDGSISIGTGSTPVVCNQHNVTPFGTSAVTYWNCWNTATYGSVLTGLSSPTQTVYQAAKVQLLLFQNATDASTFLGANQVSSDATGLGFSLNAPDNYSVVYLSGNTTVSATIRHEIGHQIDQKASSTVLSESAYMNYLMSEDWAYFNSLNKCTLFPSICNTPPYSTETNQQILGGSGTGGIPNYFNPTTTNPPGVQWHEIFAEEFALASGGGYNATIDGWLNPYFACTQTYVTSVYQNGHSATPTYSGHCSPPPVGDPLP